MNPKRIIISFITSVSIFSATAQERFEFHAGYGMYSLETMTYEYPGKAGNLIPDLTTKGSYFVTGRFRIVERFSIGLTINHFRIEHGYPYSPDKFRTFGIAPDFAFYYNRPALARVYMSGGIGVSWVYETGEKITSPSPGAAKQKFSDTYKNPFFHYSPIGLRVGKTFAAFTELGFGSKGLVNFGLSYMPGGN